MKSFGNDIDKEVDNKCKTECANCDCKRMINSDIIKGAVSKLSSGKSDGYMGIMSDHLKNGSENLYGHIANLILMMISHSTAPSSLMYSTIVPIPKDKCKSMNDAQNYRRIALSSIIGKVLDLVIIELSGNKLASSNLQYGFKKRCINVDVYIYCQ